MAARGDTVNVAQDIPHEVFEVEAVSGALMVMRRWKFERMGGFDESYFLHCEDLDLCRRMRDNGYQVLLAGDIRVHHGKGGSSRHRPVFVSRYKHRGMWRWFRQHDPASSNPLVAAAVWLGHLEPFPAEDPRPVGAPFAASMSDSRRTTTLATLGLLAMTAVWGSTFVLIKDVVGRMPVADFLAVRFVIAALAMLVMFPRSVLQLGRAQLLRGLLLGVIYGAGQLLQTWGLALIAPSVSGFVTGMYVVFTPILAMVLLRQRMATVVWVAVALSTVGLGMLSLHGVSVGLGVWLTLASAVMYGLHIVGLGQWSRHGEAFGMSAVQMVAIAVVCLLATLPHGPVLPPDPSAWFSVLYMALIAGAGAMLMQTWAQSHLPATRAAIVMTTEPVFAAAFAVMFGADVLSWRMLVGGGLILAAMYLVELMPQRKAITGELPTEAVHHEV